MLPTEAAHDSVPPGTPAKSGQDDKLTAIRAPEGEDGTEATVLAWMKEPGDPVTMHEPLLELSTDKVTVEVPSPAAGILHEIICGADATVTPGDVLGRIRPAVAEIESAHASAGPRANSFENDDEIDWSNANAEEFPGYRLSPLVRRMLREHGLSPDAITGTGRGGRITHRDVLAHLSGDDAIEESARGDAGDEAAHEPRDATASGTSAEPPSPLSPETGNDIAPIRRESIRVPHSTMRRTIATHMVDSMLRTAPHVTSVFEADLSAVLRHKRGVQDDVTRRGLRLTLSSYFVQAIARAAQAVPQMNSRWHDDALEIFPTIDVGLATALGDEGLVVPVIRNAHTMDLWQTAAAIDDVTKRARVGALTRADVSGGTITLTNHGVSGSLIATPIINQPQSAIVGIGRVEKRVKVVSVNGQDTIQILPMAYITATIDHRALDGHQANRFLTILVETLERWS